MGWFVNSAADNWKQQKQKQKLQVALVAVRTVSWGHGSQGGMDTAWWLGSTAGLNKASMAQGRGLQGCMQWLTTCVASCSLEWTQRRKWGAEVSPKLVRVSNLLDSQTFRVTLFKLKTTSRCLENINIWNRTKIKFHKSVWLHLSFHYNSNPIF